MFIRRVYLVMTNTHRPTVSISSVRFSVDFHGRTLETVTLGIGLVSYEFTRFNGGRVECYRLDLEDGSGIPAFLGYVREGNARDQRAIRALDDARRARARAASISDRPLELDYDLDDAA